MLVIPRQDSPLKIDLMGTLLNAVTFSGIDHHFGFNAERSQRMIKFVGLHDGDAGIIFTVENERRCSAVLDEVECGIGFI